MEAVRVPIDLEQVIWPKIPFSLFPSLVLLARRGSEAHGTYRPPVATTSTDDRDLYAIVVPPPDFVLGVNKPWATVQEINDPWDVVIHELRSYVRMLCSQNPPFLGMLWLDPQDYLFLSTFGQKLLELRNSFRFRTPAYNSFQGYADGQLRAARNPGEFRGYMGNKRKELVKRFGYDCKSASHAIRLLRTGCEYLETGQMNVFRKDDAEELVEIKQGKWELRTVMMLSFDLFERLKRALDANDFPEFPDPDYVDSLVANAFLSHWESQ